MHFFGVVIWRGVVGARERASGRVNVRKQPRSDINGTPQTAHTHTTETISYSCRYFEYFSRILKVSVSANFLYLYLYEYCLYIIICMVVEKRVVCVCRKLVWTHHGTGRLFYFTHKKWTSFFAAIYILYAGIIRTISFNSTRFDVTKYTQYCCYCIQS